jgi:hypothetical protein
MWTTALAVCVLALSGGEVCDDMLGSVALDE